VINYEKKKVAFHNLIGENHLNILDLISKVGKQEETLLYSGEFISPIFGNDTVVARIEGLIYTFKINKLTPGWYIFKAKDIKVAAVSRTAELSDKDMYLRALPQVRMHLSFKKEGVYYANPLKNNKFKLQHNLLYPIYLTDDRVMDFDRVVCRYDGVNFWYEDIDMSADPTKAQYLRDSLEKFVMVDKLRFSGLTIEEKTCYAIRLATDKKLLEGMKELQIKGDVEHGGGKFISFQEKSDHFKVTFEVEGNRYTSHIAKTAGHKVITAGICLSGGDTAFDLKSLIGVMREGQERGLIHQTMRE
jgi:hypothetical protein